MRLRRIAAILRAAYTIPESNDAMLDDLISALDSSELREIILEIRALQDERLAHLERLLLRHAANDK